MCEVCIEDRLTLVSYTLVSSKIYSLDGNKKYDLVEYFMQQVRNSRVIYFTNRLKDNIC